MSESNLEINAHRKHGKYATLIADLKNRVKSVMFGNLSISSLGISTATANPFLMCMTPLILKISINTTPSSYLQQCIFTPISSSFIVEISIGADYVGAWGLEPPLENATGGLSPL